MIYRLLAHVLFVLKFLGQKEPFSSKDKKLSNMFSLKSLFLLTGDFTYILLFRSCKFLKIRHSTWDTQSAFSIAYELLYTIENDKDRSFWLHALLHKNSPNKAVKDYEVAVIGIMVILWAKVNPISLWGGRHRMPPPPCSFLIINPLNVNKIMWGALTFPF